MNLSESTQANYLKSRFWLCNIKINDCERILKTLGEYLLKYNLIMSKRKIRIKSAREKNLFKISWRCQKGSSQPFMWMKPAFGWVGWGEAVGIGKLLKVLDGITDMKNAYIIWVCNKVTKSYYVNSIYIDSIVPAKWWFRWEGLNNVTDYMYKTKEHQRLAVVIGSFARASFSHSSNFLSLRFVQLFEWFCLLL